MEAAAQSAMSAMSGASGPAMVAAVAAVAGVSFRFRGGIGTTAPETLAKQPPSPSLIALRKNRSDAIRPMPNPTLLQRFVGGLAASLVVIVYNVAPPWIFLCAYLLLVHPTELWAWMVMSPVIISVVLPPIPSKRMFTFIFSMSQAYFEYESVMEQNLQELEKLMNSRSVLFAMQPHGVLSWGGLCGSLHWEFFDPHKTPTAVADVIMRTPLIKHLIGLFGTIDASKYTIQTQLNKKNGHVCLYIGGIAELFLSSPNEERLYLEKRKGFIKLALRTGAEIVPIYFFGNNRALNISRHKLIAKIARVTGVALTPMWGYWGTCLPIPTKMVSVVGKPLNMPVRAVENPTAEMVDKYHALYKQEIQRIFDTYKDMLPNSAAKELVIE